MPTQEQPPAQRRLDGWKQIAGYLGLKERGAQRWEEELGLPVHREKRKKRDFVFAFTHEIDAWREERHSPPDVAPAVTQPAGLETRATVRLRAEIGILAVGAIMLMDGRGHVPTPESPVQMGRLLVRSTSEGRTPTRIRLPLRPYFLALSPDGAKLFAADVHGRMLAIVNTNERTVHSLMLPIEAGALVASRKGILYVGSSNDGIAAVDVRKEKLIGGTIPTGGPVRGMAITPDGDKLYLAMEQWGLKRLLTGAEKVDQISDRVCPESVAVDGQGKNLYVAYQCSGPGGRPGHDSVEVFDLAKETSIGIISGPPTVGAPLSVSPDGKLVLVDGRDACWEPRYDHVGCPSVPSRVAHLVRASDRRLLWTFDFHRSAPEGFLDNSRLVVRGKSVYIIDATRYTELESWTTGEAPQQGGVVDFGRHRVYLGFEKNSLMILEVEGPECPSSNGLAMFYPGDGTMEDGAGRTTLTPRGDVRFVPGRVGQAFFLDGSSYISTSWTSNYRFLIQDSTLALYVKLARIDGEVPLVDWSGENPPVGIRLVKAADNDFVFQSWPGGGVVTSKSAVKAGLWYHVVVTKTDQSVVLYVNGEVEGRGGAPARFYDVVRPLLFGARNPGKAGFHGWLDEIAFYRRALNADEVKALYQSREVGPCKLP